MTLLKAKEISKTFDFPVKTTILKDISFTISPGTTTAIVGSSGEGKSTLLHILSGLESASHGSVEIGGEKLTLKNSARLRLHNIGFVFQGFHLMHGLSLAENLLIPARIAKLDLIEMSERAEKLCSDVGLSHRMDHPVHLLSGGEQQRAAIARALMLKPRLLFADEPTGNLDNESSKNIHQLLLSCVQEECAVVIVTHSKELAEQCERTLLIKNGTLSEPALR